MYYLDFGAIRNFLILCCRNMILVNKISKIAAKILYYVYSVPNADIRLFVDNFAIINHGRLFYPNYNFSA